MVSSRENGDSPDVVVIGGGPAGSTTATLLAQQGYKVELFERERFPRFHIGESLIPETYWVLKRLDMLPKMRASRFVKKYSVQFVSQKGKLSEPFYFMEHKPHECSQTWQVLRSEFDQLYAYLQIMSLRMGPRLTYTLDLPNFLQIEAIPSMLLQPLVENAIKHGLEPKVGDGWVGVVAKRTDQGLEISVSDSGVGLPVSKATNGSYGMLHVRERLKVIYGPAATLTLAALEPQGVRATVRIPQ